jgi:hypothetical protein
VIAAIAVVVAAVSLGLAIHAERERRRLRDRFLAAQLPWAPANRVLNDETLREARERLRS